MAKKKRGKKHPFRNAAPRAPRTKPEPEETPLKRLAATAGGAAGTALAGSFLAHEGWAPKTIATALAAVGAGLAWKGDAPTIRSVGTVATAPATKKPSNASNALPPGALESALGRAQARLSISAREHEGSFD